MEGVASHYREHERLASINGKTSLVRKVNSTLPPLIKIDQTIPVGYTMENSHSNHIDEPSSPEENSTEMMTVSSPPSPHLQYRPTVISLNTMPITTTSNFDFSPKPLVPAPDADRPERMRDWLVRMINSGKFPGLKWLDQEKMIFRVPWIHAKKRDYNQERDAALFREWAIHSGKYGDGSDVTTWKINFRCALNGLKDIIERRELEEPDCRVYQMLPSTSAGRRRKRKRAYYSEVLTYQPPERDVRPRVELTSPVTTPTTPHTSSLSTTLGIPTATITAAIPATTTPTPIQVLPIVTRANFRLPIAGFASVATLPSPSTPQGTPVATPIATPVVTPAGTPVGIMQKLKPMVVRTVPELRSDSPVSRDGSSQPQTPRTPASPANHFSPKVISSHISSPSYHENTTIPGTGVIQMLTTHAVPRSGPLYCPPPEFCTNPNAITVRILYGSITVHMETFDCSSGARIYYGPLHRRNVLPPDVEEKLFGPLDAHQIQLSPRHPAPLAKEIFNTVKRGLILEVEDQCIYTSALCRAVVYHGCSPLKHSGMLRKEDRLRVFNYNHRFLPALKYHLDGHGAPPKPYVILSFGQPWGGERPLSRNLVTVVVTYCNALNDLRVRNVPVHDELLFEAQEGKDIRIISPTPGDLEAEEFLNPTATS